MEFDTSDLQWVEYDILLKFPHLTQGTFLRHGGSSKGAYSSLNASDAVGDHPDSVKVNRELIRKTIGATHLSYVKQMHGTTIVEVDEKSCSKVREADGLITTCLGISLMVTHADCQAAIFYDPVQERIGIAHAGWKGMVKNIYQSMVDAFVKKGSVAKDLIVAVSPSIGPDHAEFKNYKEEFPQDFWGYQVKAHYFDLWAIATAQLTKAGVQERNIEIANVCSYCNPKDYYSFRRDKMTGRNATVVALKTK